MLFRIFGTQKKIFKIMFLNDFGHKKVNGFKTQLDLIDCHFSKKLLLCSADFEMVWNDIKLSK